MTFDALRCGGGRELLGRRIEGRIVLPSWMELVANLVGMGDIETNLAVSGLMLGTVDYGYLWDGFHHFCGVSSM